MSELAIMAASAKMTLREIAKQAEGLGIGLDNAAPVGKGGTANPSVQYLLKIAEQLSKLSEACGQFE